MMNYLKITTPTIPHNHDNINAKSGGTVHSIRSSAWNQKTSGGGGSINSSLLSTDRIFDDPLLP